MANKLTVGSNCIKKYFIRIKLKWFSSYLLNTSLKMLLPFNFNSNNILFEEYIIIS